MPNPSGDGASVDLTLPYPAWTELAVFDAQGARVRTIHAAMLPVGVTHLRWDGRTDHGRAVQSGVYFLRMNAGGRVLGQRLVLVR